MEKPYDLKDLSEKLVAAGLPEVEDAAEKVYGAMKNWLVESAKLTTMPFDNLAFQFLDQLDPIIKPQLDKIDGQPG